MGSRPGSGPNCWYASTAANDSQHGLQAAQPPRMRNLISKPAPPPHLELLVVVAVGQRLDAVGQLGGHLVDAAGHLGGHLRLAKESGACGAA